MKLQINTCSRITSQGLILSFLTLFVLSPVYESTQILYLQESSQVYTTYNMTLISALTTSFTTSYKYAMSSWVKMPTIPSDWTKLWKLSISYTYSGNSERLLMAQICSGYDETFSIGTPSVVYYDWIPWEGLTPQEMYPIGQWVFIALATDSTINTQYGFRYYPTNATTQYMFYSTRVLTDVSYNVTPSDTVFWGGDTVHPSYGQVLQFVRLYIDYVPSSKDQMLNIAMMEPGAILFLPILSTDYGVVQNLTIPVTIYQNTSSASSTLPILATQTPTFGPYNSIMCRPGAMFSYSVASLAQGINVAFDVQIHSPATTAQNLFSVRDDSSNYVSLTTYYNPSDGLIKVQLQNPTWDLVCASATAITADNWNRIVVELQRALPNELGFGYYSCRIFVDQTTPTRTYFGNLTTNPLFQDTTSGTIDICSTLVSGSSTRNSSMDGNYDMANFVAFHGDESLWSNSSDPTCYLTGYLSPNQYTCLICASGYNSYNGRTCVSSCPTTTIQDPSSDACEACYYPSRYYTITGYCVPCTLANELISGSECIICDSTCATCSGALPTQCETCYANTYFLTGNTSCVACNVPGYYISGTNCSLCDSSCLTCNGAAATNCLSCSSGTYLLSSNLSCVTCNVNNYGISGTSCVSCDSSCLTCNGTTATSCYTCPSGKYLLSSNQSCISCNVNGYFTSGSNCLQCDPSCLTCNGAAATNCLSCSSGTYLLSSNQSCVACNVNNYGISGTSCVSCDSSCLTCNDTTATSCYTCPSGKYLLSSNHSCISCNVNGYFTSGSNCLQCDPSCLTCNGAAATNCLSCSSGTYLLSSNQSCVACNANNYGISGTSCVSCDSSCLTCNGTTTTSCYTCPSGKYFISSNDSCVSCNVNGYFPSGSNCLQCDPSCLTCNGLLPTNCLSCPLTASPPTYLLSLNQSCVECNGNGYFVSDGNCLSCDPSCLTCNGTAASNCLNCASGTLSLCSISGYATCISLSSCPTCNSGYFFQSSPSVGSCESTCPSGYYGDNSTNTCKPCYSGSGSSSECATCTAGGSQDCISCYSNTFLYPNHGGQCLSQCPSGYWEDNSTSTCQLCTLDSAEVYSCPSSATNKTAFVLQNIATSFVAASVAFSSAIQDSGSTSFMNYLLYLSAIESIANMQFLNINHSEVASGAYEGLASTFIPNWIAKYNTIDTDQLVFHYGIFEKNQVSSLFLDNYGDLLTQSMAYWGACLLGFILTKCQDPTKLINSRTGKFYAITLGLFLSNVFGQIQSQLLFSILQIIKIDLLVDSYSRASYFVACFTTSSMIGLLIFSFFKVKAIFRAKKKEGPRKTSQSNPENGDIKDYFKARWKEKRFALLFDDFKEDNKKKFFFSYWLCLFDTVYILLILVFQSIPVLQCVSIIIFTLAFIILSAVVKPMKERGTALFFFFNFGCVLSVAFVNMILAISEAVNGQAVNNESFGKAVYSMIMINTGVNMLFGLAGIGFGIYLLISRRLKRRKTSNKIVPVNEQNEIVPVNEQNEREAWKELEPNSANSLSPKFSQVKEDQTASPERHSQEDRVGDSQLSITHNRKKSILLREIEGNGSSGRSTSALPLQPFLQVGESDESPSKIKTRIASPFTRSPGHFLNLDPSRIDERSSKRITDDVNGNFIQDL